MNKNSFKSKTILVTVFLIITLLFVYKANNKVDQETTTIFEIENTQVAYYTPDTMNARIEKHFMIIKPPEDLHELKTLVEEFTTNNPVNIEIAKGEIKNQSIEKYIDIKETYVALFFYRESRKLSRTWQPNEAYMDIDRIDHHKDDLIAAIYWTDSDSQKSYTVIKKSSDKETYGEIIERIEYKDE